MPHAVLRLCVFVSVFYLDTPDNARANGMDVTMPVNVQKMATDKSVDTIWPLTSTTLTLAVCRLLVTEDLIKENGGRISSDVDDPRITHILIFKRDTTRKVALMRRTQK